MYLDIQSAHSSSFWHFQTHSGMCFCMMDMFYSPFQLDLQAMWALYQTFPSMCWLISIYLHALHIKMLAGDHSKKKMLAGAMHNSHALTSGIAAFFFFFFFVFTSTPTFSFSVFFFFALHWGLEFSCSFRFAALMLSPLRLRDNLLWIGRGWCTKLYGKSSRALCMLLTRWPPELHLKQPKTNRQ